MPVLGAEVATVALGLIAALSWGAADFGGGLSARRAPLFGVVLFALLVGDVLAVVGAIARHEAVPGALDVGWAICGGVCGGFGITALYQGLATGRMGVVAPVTGVLAAAVPVVAGFGLEGLPGPRVELGIALAIASVVLVSRTHDPASGPSGLSLAIVAGTGLGLLAVCISRVSHELLFGPVAIARTTELLLVLAVIVVARRQWRLPRPAIAGVVAVGCLDVAGNSLFLAAAQTGRLDVASVVSSLYPVTTIVLAVLVLGERVTRDHAIGIAVAIAAIGLIAAG
jgi:drug/metabolite transporter (DMT)-like permease